MHDKPHSNEAKLKCSIAQKKRWESGAYKNKLTHSDKTKLKIKKSLQKGSYSNCPQCNKKVYSSPSRKRKYCSRKCHGISSTGENNPLYKHGNSRCMKDGYYSTEYKNWRKAVFEKDDYTCQMCLERGGSLNAHHIKPFAKYEKLRFSLLNGMTLCIDCHRKIHRLHKKVIGG